MEKKIDYRFKILYALGIIFIVAGHVGNGGISLFYDWFPPYGFHLGLFVFCSGYFYRSQAENEIGGYIWKKVKRLLIPLYLWNFFYGFVVWVMSFAGFSIGEMPSLYNLFVAPLCDGHQFQYNLGGWFVAPLFMVEVLNVLIRKPLGKWQGPAKEIALFVLYLCLGIAGVVLSIRGINTGWWLVLTRLLYFLPFYGAGILYRQVLEEKDTLDDLWYFAIVLGAQLVIIFICGEAPYCYPSWCTNFEHGPVVPFVTGFLGIAFWLRMAKLLEPSIGKSRWVNALADNTFSIMINQFMGYMIIKSGCALVAKFSHHFTDFDWAAYKGNAFYYYIIGGQKQTVILYLIAGLVFPILLQKLIDRVKGKFAK